jgi:hypothetical protein
MRYISKLFFPQMGVCGEISMQTINSESSKTLICPITSYIRPHYKKSIYLSVPYLEQDFSAFPTRVEFQHINT